ncbi:MAG: hypothetical protein WCO69_03650 [Candidatus Omnitrophota bacterium]
MKKVLGVFSVVLVSLLIVRSTPAHAQDAAPAAAPAAAVTADAAVAPAAPAAVTTEEDKFSFGKVISVADGVVTVKEYDFAKDVDVETSYSVTAETELGNINAVADLKAGDDIVIDYLDKEGKRVVTTLVKEEKGTEAMPGEGEAAQAPAAAAEVPAAATEPAPAAVPEAAPAAEVPAQK